VQPQLQPNTPLTGEQAREPSVFFDGATFDKVLRLPIPMHPVVFVNQAVNVAQQERQSTDAQSFSDPAGVDNSDAGESRLLLQIGTDPNLFVQHAVRGSQDDSRVLSNTVSGRLDRLSLSSDRWLPTPGLHLMDSEFQSVQQAMEQEAQRRAQTNQPAGAAPGSTDELPPERPLSEAPSAQPLAPPASHPQHSDPSALSFSAQLKKGSSRLPLASRAAQAPKTV